VDEAMDLRKNLVRNVPDMVVHPKNKSDVQKIVSYCNGKKIPIYVFSGGSSVTFGLNTPKAGIMLVMSTHMNKLIDINELNQTATVQPGMFGPAYEDALNVLDNSYLKIYNTFNTVDSIQGTYFYGYDQESLKVKEDKESIKNAKIKSKSYLDIAGNQQTNENIDNAVSEIKKLLVIVSDSLIVIRDECESSFYANTVSSANKTLLDTEKTNINTGLTNLTNSEQTISSTKLTNESNINTAKTSVSSAEGALKTAQNELILFSRQ
jgi:hypothetical protein